MRWLPRRPWLPLLGKDLAEMAARRRTYVLRVVYAVLLYGFFLLFLGQMVGHRRSPTALMGSGRNIFNFFLTCQFIGIYVLLPAIMCGAVTYEKESRSLELLFVTDLRPAEIVVQKFAGRLVPMFSFLLLGLPVLAIAYAYGGVPTAFLQSSVYVLFLTCLQVGALALLCSCFFATTTRSFIASYILCAVLYGGPVLAVALLFWGRPGGPPSFFEEVAFGLFPPYVLLENWNGGFSKVLLHGIPIVLSALAFLGAARLFVVRRAFVGGSGLFRALDRFWKRINRNPVTRGIELWHDRETLPGERPVAWREKSRRALGRVSWLLRVFCLVEVPVLFIAGVMLSLDADREPIAVMMLLGWPLLVLFILAAGVNLFASERSGRTLEVLLATPVPGRDIVLQKMSGLRRLLLVLAAPVVTLVAIELWIGDPSRSWDLEAPAYLASWACILLTYFFLFAWMSTWMGMRVRSRAKALIAAVGGVLAWAALPVILLALVDNFAGLDIEEPPVSYLLLLSPASMVISSEIPYGWDELFEGYRVLPIVLNSAFYGGIGLIFRHLCLRKADRYLSRVGESAAERGDVLLSDREEST